MLKIFRLVLLLSLCSIFNAAGQYSRLAWFMDIPQNRFLNPAFEPADSIYIGLPVISGAGLSIDNNFLRHNDLLFMRNDSLLTIGDPGFDDRKLLRHTAGNNHVEADAFVQLFGIAFRVWRGFLMIDVNERLGLTGKIPGSAVRLAVIDPADHIGEDFDFSEGRAGLTYFREFGLGYSWNQTPKLRAGAKVKLLAGIGSMYSGFRKWMVRLDGSGYMTDVAIDMNVSAPLKINYNNDGSIDEVDLQREESIKTILMKRGINPGVAIDIGVNWFAADRVTLSASLTDIGFISWRNDNFTFRINEEFDFSSFNITPSGSNNSINAISDRFLDSLQNLVKVNVLHYPYTETLSPALYAGAEYIVIPHFTVGLLSRTRFIAGDPRQSFTLSANYTSRRMSVTFGYTAANRMFNNLGAGVSLRAGPVQLYLIADRIPLSWDMIDTDFDYTVPLPRQWNTFDLRAGLNLLFHKTEKGIECEFPYRKEIKAGRHRKRSGFLF